jgi:hypothetical protein
VTAMLQHFHDCYNNGFTEAAFPIGTEHAPSKKT